MIFSEDIMSTVRNIITDSIKSNTHNGFIYWRDCDNICRDMYECLDICEEALQMYEYMLALETAIYILERSVKLASYADSSSGMFDDVVFEIYGLINRCTKIIEKQDKQARDKALLIIIKSAKKKIFDGWGDWRYEFLEYGICLCDEKSAKKFEKALDIILESSRKAPYPEYNEKEDIVVRYLLHRHLYGKETVKKELYDNLSVDRLCILAVEDAMEEKNYTEAEKLCLTKATGFYNRYDPKDWNNLLYDIYEKANNKEKQI